MSFPKPKRLYHAFLSPGPSLRPSLGGAQFLGVNRNADCGIKIRSSSPRLSRRKEFLPHSPTELSNAFSSRVDKEPGLIPQTLDFHLERRNSAGLPRPAQDAERASEPDAELRGSRPRRRFIQQHQRSLRLHG